MRNRYEQRINFNHLIIILVITITYKIGPLKGIEPSTVS